MVYELVRDQVRGLRKANRHEWKNGHIQRRSCTISVTLVQSQCTKNRDPQTAFTLPRSDPDPRCMVYKPIPKNVVWPCNEMRCMDPYFGILIWRFSRSIFMIHHPLPMERGILSFLSGLFLPQKGDPPTTILYLPPPSPDEEGIRHLHIRSSITL